MSASVTPTPSPEPAGLSAIGQIGITVTQICPAGLSAIGQIGITVTQIERAVEFYRDALGLKLLFQVPAPPMAFFDCGGVRLMLSVSETVETYSSVIYYRVPEIQQAFAALTRRGVPFEGEPHLVARMPGHELWMAFFRDPDRNLLALMCEVPA